MNEENIKTDYADQFKGSSMKNTISNLLNKYKPKEKSDLKKTEVIEVIQVLEKEKEQEKDEKTRADIEHLIQVIKDLFAKKFNAEKERFNAQKAIQTTFARLKEARVLNKTREIIKNNQRLEQQMKKIAEVAMGDTVIQELINKFQLTKESKEKQQATWQRTL